MHESVAYVPQEDVLYNELTVEENIMFSAMLFNRRGLRKNQDLYPLVKMGTHKKEDKISVLI